MALETKINRIQTNVTAALAALAEKGVTVPSGANSDDLAELIGAIESGGGGVKFARGTITPASQTYTWTLEHNLGVVPKFIVIYIFPGTYGVANCSLIVLYIDYNAYPDITDQPYTSNGMQYNSKYAAMTYNGNRISGYRGVSCSHTENSTTFANASLMAAAKYAWVAIG